MPVRSPAAVRAMTECWSAKLDVTVLPVRSAPLRAMLRPRRVALTMSPEVLRMSLEASTAAVRPMTSPADVTLTPPLACQSPPTMPPIEAVVLVTAPSVTMLTLRRPILE